jgi:hypothetical protein
VAFRSNILPILCPRFSIEIMVIEATHELAKSDTAATSKNRIMGTTNCGQIPSIAPAIQ